MQIMICGINIIEKSKNSIQHGKVKLLVVPVANGKTHGIKKQNR